MVETDRLNIIPLTCSQLTKYLKADNKLEEELALTSTGRIISEEVKDLVELFTLPKMKGINKHNYLFYTFWIVVNKSTKIIVAELGFKGPPGRDGNIEIGYGTMPDHQHNGYMTEAVGGMLKWAIKREDVKGVLAETNQKNMASVRIVQKNGFQQFDKRGEMLWWRVRTEEAMG
jgi:ribosomal-protein-alanine N-acetyltransferase